MKRILKIAISCLVMASVLCTVAAADVIVEPQDNFYEQHKDECDYVNRSYFTNGQTGYTEFFSKPDGKSLSFSENGETYLVQFVYTDKTGVQWGIAGSDDLELLTDASWVKMDDLMLRYDFQSFYDEHEDAISDFDGDVSGLAGISGINLWTYPRSGEVARTLQEPEENFNFEYAYTDDDGLLWGYVGYFKGVRNVWVCVSDPANMEIAAYETPAPEFFKPSSDTPPEPTGNGINMTAIAFALVAVVIALTLILVLKKKKSK